MKDFNFDIQRFEDISNYVPNTLISGTSSADSIYNYSPSVTIDAGAGDDSIKNSSSNVSINGGDGNDSILISSDTENITINGGKGADLIDNAASNVTIDAGDDNDYIWSYYGNSVSIDAGAGNDSIDNYDSKVTIKGGAGNDSIKNSGANALLYGGKGNDIISLSSSAQNNLIQYESGDGNDSITGLNSDDTLQITGAEYTTTTSGNNLIVGVGSGKITVVGGANVDFTIDGTLGGGGNDTTPADTTPAATLPVGITVKNSVLTALAKFTGNEINLADYNATKVNASALTQAVEIYGNNNNNSIKGGKGADTISGGSGKNTLTGGNGADIFVYAGGNDLITDYKAGEDKIDVSYTSSSVKGSDVILTTAEGTVSIKGAKDKVVTFADGTEKIFFADTSYSPLETGLTYDAKRTILTASNKFTGNEIDLENYLSTVTKVNASAANTALEIVGNNNNNSIKGGKGADTISGGTGKNTLTGGNGKDIFIYGGGNDTITDYTAEDKIKIDGTISNTSYKGKDVIFEIGGGTLTVKNAKDKEITFADSTAKTLDLLYDNNFATDDFALDDITKQKFEVTEMQSATEPAQEDKTLITYTDK